MTDAAERGTTRQRCDCCGEAFPGPHDCDMAREARALFEAAQRANSPEGADRLSLMALDLATKAGVVRAH